MCLIILLRRLEPMRDQFDVGARGSRAFRRFLLKRVQHVDDLAVTRGVDRSVRVARMVFDDFENSRPFAFPRLGLRVFAAKLRNAQRVPNLLLHRFRKSEKIAL